MYRSGIGYDLHRTHRGRRLVLGGVEIPHEAGLLGHSDADVVLHAICDAMLGASGLGDIGELFPDNDPEYKDADSRTLLRQVVELVSEHDLELVNADVVIHAQTPNLRAHKPLIRSTLAELLGLAPSRVGVKATTNEGLDAIGQGRAIAALATVLLRRADAATDSPAE